MALSPWPQTKHAPEKARRLATLVGCSSNKAKKMINCLQSRPARIISQAVGDFMVNSLSVFVLDVVQLLAVISIFLYYFFLYSFLFFCIKLESLITVLAV